MYDIRGTLSIVPLRPSTTYHVVRTTLYNATYSRRGAGHRSLLGAPAADSDGLRGLLAATGYVPARADRKVHAAARQRQKSLRGEPKVGPPRAVILMPSLCISLGFFITNKHGG